MAGERKPKRGSLLESEAFEAANSSASAGQLVFLKIVQEADAATRYALFAKALAERRSNFCQRSTVTTSDKTPTMLWDNEKAVRVGT